MIELYAPHNAKSLTQEQLKAMEGLTKEDFKALSSAYPTNPVERPYLILKDKTRPDNKQTFPRATWTNLFELFKLGQTQYVPFSFVSIFKQQEFGLKVAPTQDLTNQEAKAELKTASLQKASATTNQELKVAGEQEANGKTAADIAAEENAGLEDKANEKPLEKMNLDELSIKYEKVTGDVPEGDMKKADLIKAIQAKSKK